MRIKAVAGLLLIAAIGIAAISEHRYVAVPSVLTAFALGCLARRSRFAVVPLLALVAATSDRPMQMLAMGLFAFMLIALVDRARERDLAGG